MCNQINIRPDSTTKLWLTREAQKANIPVSTLAKNILQEAAAEQQKIVDFEFIAEETATRLSLKILSKLDSFAE